MRCVNRSSAPANIGLGASNLLHDEQNTLTGACVFLGFISDMDTDEENIHTAFIFSNVGCDLALPSQILSQLISPVQP